jgi:hypothetical protein
VQRIEQSCAAPGELHPVPVSSFCVRARNALRPAFDVPAEPARTCDPEVRKLTVSNSLLVPRSYLVSARGCVQYRLPAEGAWMNCWTG